ncbi:hypothetical protein [Vreelandella venusta]|uniref:hypothetical protein n=1 Tax=Vreelandella venusta TaxID=44935 RepID=UPI00117118EB|nr:hypothetical protein [Halomonas venusta]GEK52373.1 hypothetical protein HVE01_30940 [Halomonas venusta]
MKRTQRERDLTLTAETLKRWRQLEVENLLTGKGNSTNFNTTMAYLKDRMRRLHLPPALRK